MDQSEGTTLVRRALTNIDPQRVLDAVDSLNLQPSGRVEMVILAPLRNLKKSRIVSSFASSAPFAAVRFLGELLSNDALDRVVEILGDNAGDPTLDQLTSAVELMLVEGVGADDVALMLALAVSSGVPAAEHCRQLLGAHEKLQLPTLSEVISTPLVQPKEVDPEIREQRRLRRESEREARQRTKSRSVERTTKPKAKTPSPGAISTSQAPVSSVLPAPTRRVVSLTPIEADRFVAEHPLAGFVVELDIPYGSADADDVGYSSKQRPAVVLAGNQDSLLVRAVFSKSGNARIVLAGWNRLGLDHVSYVSPDRIEVNLATSPVTRRFGELNDSEWNSLF